MGGARVLNVSSECLDCIFPYKHIAPFMYKDSFFFLSHPAGPRRHGTQNVSPYQQVIEKTKNLIHRNQMLAVSLEKKEAQLKQLSSAQQVEL